MPKFVQVNLQQQQPCSYYQNTKKRFLEEFKRIQQKYELSSIVLVLDLISAGIITKIFTITELVDSSIVFVERLEKVRKKLEHHAIYFITSTQQSISLMLKDFQDESRPQYRKAHVLLTASLDKDLMSLISGSPTFLKKLARHSFKQFYCELDIISDNCVHFNYPYLQLAYSKQSSRQKQMRALIAKRFVDLVAAFPKIHTVRFLYDRDNSANKIAERVVQKSAKQIKNYMLKLLQAKSIAIDPEACDITFFVVDRSIDIVTPLLHGYAYQSLLYDLLQEKGKLQFDVSKLDKTIFDQYRYRHLSYLLSELPQRLDQILAKCNSKGKINALEMKGLLQQKQKLNDHVELLHDLWKRYQQKNLREIGELQLSLATGVTEDGKQTSSTELVNQIKTIIKTNNVLSQNELTRLALLVLSCVKVTKQDYQILNDLFKGEDQLALKNLVAFGVSHDKKVTRSTKNIDKTSMDRARVLLENKSISSQRFTSVLEITLPKLIQHLNKDKNGSQSKIMGETIVSVSPNQSSPSKFDEKRLICFMCGGMSQTQICSIRRNSNLDSILLATDTILTPNSMVRSLKKIDILGK